jgi:hypothetical protein
LSEYENFEDNDEQTFEPDPAVVAHLDQEGAAFEEMQDSFEETFGFKHKCKCAEDYSSGNLVEVTQCFTTMVEEALESCQTLVQENYMLRGMLTQIFAAADIVQGEVPADPNPDDTEVEVADDTQ